MRASGQAVPPRAAENGDAESGGEPASHQWQQSIPIVPGEVVTIGCDPANTLVLDDPDVAPRQAQITTNAAGQTEITNLGALSGVRVNGLPVARARLVSGADVRIGRHPFVFMGEALHPYDAASAVRVDAVDVTQTVQKGLPFVGARTVLLDDVSLTLLPGTFVAIVGASGAGKTTLLHALSGQTRIEQGRVFYNGLGVLRYRHEFCTTMGYVPQDDIVHGNLSVEAALTYAARLRLPVGTTRRQVHARVCQVLDDVGLTARHAQLVSQLSGGERKRVNIALELLARPAIFYLDEPTSGLDPGLDLKMMQLLRRLADRGQTVVLVTHATSNIDLCDDVCFLAPGGRLAYYGPPDRLKQFFHSADYPAIYNELDEHPDCWIARFRQSPDYMEYVEGPRLQAERLARAEAERAPIPPIPSTAIESFARRLLEWVGLSEAQLADSGPCGIGPVRQFWVLTQRYLDVLLHDPMTLLLLLLQAPIIAIFVRLLADHDVLHNVAAGIRPIGPPEDIYAQRVLFIVVASAIWFGIINAAREIVKEAPIYRRERAVNLRLLPYVLSKVAVLGGLLALQDFILLAIVGTKTGYPGDGLFLPGTSGAFAELYVTLLLVSCVGLMLGLLVSALSPNTDRAVSIVPVLLIPQIIFANVIFVLDGNVGRWISYLMPSRWGMQAAGSTVGLADHFTDHILFPFYASDMRHVLGFWLALAVLAAAFLGLTLLAMRAKDIRQ